MIANIYLAKTNYIIANYKNPDNYTNEFTRDYALTIQNNEQSGNGSSVQHLFLPHGPYECVQPGQHLLRWLQQREREWRRNKIPAVQ